MSATICYATFGEFRRHILTISNTGHGDERVWLRFVNGGGRHGIFEGRLESSGLIQLTQVGVRAMSDVFTKEFRSEVMRRVRREKTLDEELLFRELRSLGLRAHQNDAALPGRPDIVVRASRLVVFVDGDFWHGRAWFEERRAPRTNRDFWIKRFEDNRQRDRRVDRQLRALGWRVTRVWGSDVRRNTGRVAKRVMRRAKLLMAE